MEQKSILKYFLSKKYSGVVIFFFTSVFYCLSLYKYILFSHEEFDFSVKAIHFTHLISDNRGRNPHIFRAFWHKHEIMTFDRSGRVPSLKKLMTKRLPEAGAGIAYCVDGSGILGGNSKILLGVEFLNGIKVGTTKLPEGFKSGRLNSMKKMAAVTTTVVVLQLLFLVYVYFQYKEKRNE